ncbi:MAG: hypothetical protein ABJA98_21420 [Acidobacteriota bacterium]
MTTTNDVPQAGRMTLHQVLERAAEMQVGERWRVFQDVCGGHHDPNALPPVTTGGVPTSPHYCPVCFTVFGPASFRMWNPPTRTGIAEP